MAILVLITLLLVLPTVYLLYVRFNKKKLKKIKAKHPAGSKNFETYRVLYSTRTLIFLSFLSLLLITDLLENIYKNTQPEGSIRVALFAVGGILLPLGLWIWWSVTDKKKRKR